MKKRENKNVVPNKIYKGVDFEAKRLNVNNENANIAKTRFFKINS